MTLGQRIYRLRTEKGMSQGDLADALGVSRQSVSKWETDGSVPDLDKLVRLCEVFDVSMDCLVRGKEPTPEREGHTGTEAPSGKDENNFQSQAASPKGTDDAGAQAPFADGADAGSHTGASGTPDAVTQPARTGMEPRKVAGTILLCMAFVVVLLFTMLGGFLTGLLFCSPFLLCGLVCFIFRKHVGLWCGWAVLLAAHIYLRLATGISWSMVALTLSFTWQMNYARLAIAWFEFLYLGLMIVLTVWKLGKRPLELSKRALVWLIAGWMIYVVLRIPIRLPQLPTWSYDLVYTVFGVLEWVRVVVLTAVLIHTVRYIRAWRRAAKG